EVDDGTHDGPTGTGIASLTLAPDTFTCADVGENIVLFTAVDFAGNSASANVTITVRDTIAPAAQGEDITLSLDENGEATLSDANFALPTFSRTVFTYSYNLLAINYGSLDGFDPESLDGTFMLLNGLYRKVFFRNYDNIYIYLYIDVNEQDNTIKTGEIFGPINGTKLPISFHRDQLNSECEDSITISFSQSLFTCADIGENTVVVTTSDKYGNSATKSITVT